MFWLKNKKNDSLLRTLIWGPGICIYNSKITFNHPLITRTWLNVHHIGPTKQYISELKDLGQFPIQSAQILTACG